MRRALAALPLLIALGCVPSENPYYLPEEVVFVEALVGQWEGTDPGNPGQNALNYVIEKGEGKAYKVNTENNNYDARIFRMGGHYFADVVPVNEPKLHLLFKVALLGNGLELYFYDPEWLKRLLDKDPKAIAHERKGSEVERLTASEKDLRAFALKYVEDANAFGKPLRLTARNPIPVPEAGFGDKKHRTLDYWYELCMTARGAYNNGLLKELARIAADLEGLPTKGVDAEAIECGKQAAATYKALLKHVEGLKVVPQKLETAFERYGDTDRLGAATALIEDKGLREQIDKTIALFEKTRETLAKRHGATLMGIR